MVLNGLQSMANLLMASTQITQLYVSGTSNRVTVIAHLKAIGLMFTASYFCQLAKVRVCFKGIRLSSFRRPVCLAVFDNLVVMGHGSGGIKFIEFKS